MDLDYKEIQENLIHNLKYIRKKNDLSMDELGKILGVSKQSIYKMEKGKSNISLKHLSVLSKTYKIPLIELITKKTAG